MARTRKGREIMTNAASKRLNWNIAIYIRLSREDGNDESFSITNQKKIILEYLERQFEGEYTVVDVYADDGASGTDYERPAFQRMIQDMERGTVNCIICKNLSRAFRNYSDQGYFLERVFPLHKTRFITLGDPKIDSFLNPEIIQGLEVPISGLMNDRYAAKTSSDIRRTFDTKRRKGEFIGAFAPYGYAKKPEDKNAFVIDEEAAQVVRDIYRWFVLDGASKTGIAKRLNELDIPNPTAYKQKNGLHFKTPYTGQNDGLWNPKTIRDILMNRVYVGDMVQGRQKVISYKVHDRRPVPEEDWYVVAGTHEAIVDAETFRTAQLLHKRDTRAAPGRREVYLFSGFLRCADCGKALTRRTSKGFVYYVCRTYAEKSKTQCSKHTVKLEVLERVLLTVIQKQIELVCACIELVDAIKNAAAVPARSQRITHSLKLRTQERDKLSTAIDSLYMDWKSGDISRTDHHRMREKFERQAEQIEEAMQRLRDENEALETGAQCDNPSLAAFLKNQNIDQLERGILAELVDEILVHKGGEIEVRFRFADQHRHSLSIGEARAKELCGL